MARKKPIYSAKPAPKPSMMIQIVNLTPDKRDITMPDGTNISLLAFSRTGDKHISDPVDYNALHPKFQELLQKQVKRREIRLTEV